MYQVMFLLMYQVWFQAMYRASYQATCLTMSQVMFLLMYQVWFQAMYSYLAMSKVIFLLMYQVWSQAMYPASYVPSMVPSIVCCWRHHDYCCWCWPADDAPESIKARAIRKYTNGVGRVQSFFSKMKKKHNMRKGIVCFEKKRAFSLP